MGAPFCLKNSLFASPIDMGIHSVQFLCFPSARKECISRCITDFPLYSLKFSDAQLAALNNLFNLIQSNCFAFACERVARNFDVNVLYIKCLDFRTLRLPFLFWGRRAYRESTRLI